MAFLMKIRVILVNFNFLVFLMFIISCITLMMMLSVVCCNCSCHFGFFIDFIYQMDVATFNCCVIFSFDLRERNFVILNPVQFKYHVYTIV